MMLPNSGITTTLVGNTLGTSSRKVRELCTHDSINMFSKYKPVKQPHVNVDNIPDYWKASNGNCGIVLPVTLSAPTGGPMAKWYHDAPAGGASSPYRLGDFRRYNHEAPPLFSMHPDPKIYTGKPFLCSIVQNSNAEIKVTDINDMYTGYIGLIIIAPNGDLRFVTAYTPIGQGETEWLLSIDIPKSWPDGTCHVYMVVSHIFILGVATSIGTGIRSLNQGAGETGYRSMELKTPIKDSFRCILTVDKDTMSGSYAVKATVTSTQGSFGVENIVVQISSDPVGNVIGIGNLTTTASTIIHTGESYTFPKTLNAYIINSDIRTYLNYDCTYYGNDMNTASGSVSL